MDWWFWLALAVGGLWLVSTRWPGLLSNLTEGGERIQRLGCGLTLAVTIPILGLVFFGGLGLVAGIVIGLLFGVGLIGQALSGAPKE